MPAEWPDLDFTKTPLHACVYRKFDSAMYGSLGLPLILLTWVWLSVFVVLFGAEINGEVERQTHQDTTGAPIADE